MEGGCGGVVVVDDNNSMRPEMVMSCWRGEEPRLALGERSRSPLLLREGEEEIRLVSRLSLSLSLSPVCGRRSNFF